MASILILAIDSTVFLNLLVDHSSKKNLEWRFHSRFSDHISIKLRFRW